MYHGLEFPRREACDEGILNELTLKEIMTDGMMLRTVSPIGGYAQGAYMCQCTGCYRHFLGARRDSQCLTCAMIALKSRVGEAPK